MQADDPAGSEVLEVGERPPTSARRRMVLAVTLVVLCVSGALAWRTDGVSREDDARAVEACREAALRADLRASNQVGYMGREVDQVLYKLPDGPQREGLLALVAKTAARTLPGMRSALARCRGSGVVWWHRDLGGRLAAYVDYLAARVRRLEQIAADGESYYRDQPRLAALRDKAFGRPSDA
jgi:hypothetical protein